MCYRSWSGGQGPTPALAAPACLLPWQHTAAHSARPVALAACHLQVTAGLKEVRDRIASVKNTMKITEAMKLVAAAKVRSCSCYC